MDAADDVDRYMEYLITEGALVLRSVDKYGDPIWDINVEKMQEIAPEYLEEYYRDIEDTVIGLFEKGLAEFDVSEDGEVVWSLTDDGEHYAQTQNLDKM